MREKEGEEPKILATWSVYMQIDRNVCTSEILVYREIAPPIIIVYISHHTHNTRYIHHTLHNTKQGITEASLRTESRNQSEESAALHAARALLQDEEMQDMQAVHSTKSVTALLKSAKDKISQVSA